MQQTRHSLIAALTAAVVSAPTVASAPGAVARGAYAGAQPTTRELDSAGLRRIARAPWRRYRRDVGGPTVHVSPAYADPAAVAQRWTSFFESLLHGPELSVLNAYVAPLSEVETMCGSSDVLGCYGDDHLVMPDQGADGISSASIATHEYGHHVAFNRVNPPRTALDWGPKRWATYERVCPRAAAGTAYPGAEDANYPLNPGEAWAETYRVLNETTTGLPLQWPIVDPSFEPGAGALAAARADVVDPWTAPRVSVKTLRFGRSARTWTMQVATPLDGELRAQIQPGSDGVTLLGSEGRTLARGSWSSSGAKGFDYDICGQRTVVLRVTRHTSLRTFTLSVSVP
jgi:hypothetical protein